MRIFLLAVSLVSLTVASSFAADLPSRKAPPPAFVPPPPMWTGFYAGLNVGYGWGASATAGTFASAYDPWAANNNAAFGQYYAQSVGGIAQANSGFANVNQNGVVGGGQIGYNYQWGASFVFGFEADMQGSDIRGRGGYSGAGSDSLIFSLAAPPTYEPLEARNTIGIGSVHAGVDWFGTARGRFGYLVTPTMLVYATGGLTYGNATASAVYNGISNYIDLAAVSPCGTVGCVYANQYLFGVAHASNTLVGWNAGGGVEWMFLPNWSVKAEAFYYDLGSMRLNGGLFAANPLGALDPSGTESPSIATSSVTQIKFNGVVARMGVNYHLNWEMIPLFFQ